MKSNLRTINVLDTQQENLKLSELIEKEQFDRKDSLSLFFNIRTILSEKRIARSQYPTLFAYCDLILKFKPQGTNHYSFISADEISNFLDTLAPEITQLDISVVFSKFFQFPALRQELINFLPLIPFRIDWVLSDQEWLNFSVFVIQLIHNKVIDFKTGKHITVDGTSFIVKGICLEVLHFENKQFVVSSDTTGRVYIRLLALNSQNQSVKMLCNFDKTCLLASIR